MTDSDHVDFGAAYEDDEVASSPAADTGRGADPASGEAVDQHRSDTHGAPGGFNSFPPDVPLILGGLLLAGLGLLVSANSLPRALLTLPLLLFLPGYATTTAVFPATSPTARRLEWRGRGRADIGILERLSLAFGLSVAIVPLVGIVSWAAVGSLGVLVVGPALAGVVLVTTAAGVRRRRAIPPERRYRGDVRAIPDWVLGDEPVLSGRRLLSGFVLVVALGLLVATFTVAILAPQNGNQYTDFALLTEDDEGNFVATGFPTNLTSEGETTLTFSVRNFEQREQRYTVVVALQDVERERVLESATIGSFYQVVARNDTWRETHDVAQLLDRGSDPGASTDLDPTEVQLTYFLYRGEPPERVSRETAYRWLALSVTSEVLGR